MNHLWKPQQPFMVLPLLEKSLNSNSESFTSRFINTFCSAQRTRKMDSESLFPESHKHCSCKSGSSSSTAGTRELPADCHQQPFTDFYWNIMIHLKHMVIKTGYVEASVYRHMWYEHTNTRVSGSHTSTNHPASDPGALIGSCHCNGCMCEILPRHSTISCKCWCNMWALRNHSDSAVKWSYRAGSPSAEALPV